MDTKELARRLAQLEEESDMQEQEMKFSALEVELGKDGLEVRVDDQLQFCVRVIFKKEEGREG